jgi:predicted Zn-dependent peptidase
MGFVTPTTLRDEGFAAMQVCNVIFGGGMTSKLFLQVREKNSLCYDIGSGYHGSKGIVTVSAGIDFDKEEPVKAQVLELLEQCRRGEFTEEELNSAKQVLISQLQGTHDAPGSIENYYISGLLSGLNKTPGQYMEAVQAVTAQQVAKAAQSLKLHTVYFLKGVR